MNKFLLFSVVVLCNTLSVFAQYHDIKGIIQDNSTLKPIPGVNVVVRNKMDYSIVTYTTTTDDGTFSLQVNRINFAEHILHITCLGYEQHILELSVGQSYAIKLKEKAFELREISIKADKIIQCQDTTSYFVSGFATAKDRTIGDVLTNMPGINVAENGRISYNGNPINKFYIEGVDLLDGKYNLATNNISYENIARVEVIENHQAIKALQGTGLDTGTAINLKLKDGIKSSWNGNVLGKGGGAPNEGLWDTEFFVARFSSKSQSLSTLKSNNSGNNISEESNTLTIDDLLYVYPDSEISGNIKSEPSISTNIDDNRTRFNRSYMFSNSNMWRLSESSQIKSQIIYTEDRNVFNQRVESSYYLTDSVLVKGTSEESLVRNRNLQASISTTIDKNKYYLSNELKYSSNWKAFTSNIIGDYDYQSFAEPIMHNVENRLKFVKKAGHNILQIVSINKYALIPEELSINGESIIRQQAIDKNNFFSNTNFRLIHNIKKWSLSSNVDILGNIYNFESLYDDIHKSYNNNLSVNYIGMRFNPEITFQNATLKLNVKFPVSLYYFSGELSDKKNYTKPEFYLKWKFMPKWTLFVNAAIGNSYIGNSLYYTSPIMTDYKSLNAGFINYDGKLEKRIGGRISYTNPSEMLFANLSVTHSIENTKKSILKQVDNDCVYYSYIPGNDKYKLWFAEGSVSKGIDFIHGAIELRSSYQKHNMPIKQNGYSSMFDFGNFNTNITIKSNTSDWLNIDYKIGYRYNYLISSNFRTSTQYIIQKCQLALYPTANMNIKLNGEHYFTFFDTGQRKNMLLADIDFVYKYKRFDFLVSIKNIFNQKRYSYTIYGNLSSTYTQYDIRERNVFLGINWYF